MTAIALASSVSAATYLLDANTGDDGRTGLSPTQAWRSLGRVNRQALQPGDAVRLKSGCVWQGQLRPQGSGTQGAPIRLDQYGEGALPVIDAAGALGAVLQLIDQDGWEIRQPDNRATAPSAPGRAPGRRTRRAW